MSFTYAGQYGPVESINAATGLLLKGAVATVYLPGTTTLATLYTDRTKGTTAANPLATDTLGNLKFFADPGRYDLLVNGTTVTVAVPMDPGEIADIVQPDTFTQPVTFQVAPTVPANSFPESAIAGLSTDLSMRPSVLNPSGDTTGVVDTAAILAAANTAPNVVVLLGTGTFYVNALVLTKNNVIIRGSDSVLTVLVAVANSQYANMISASGLTGVKVTDLTLDANYLNRIATAPPQPLSGITLSAMTDSSVERVIVKNTYGVSGSANSIAFGGGPNVRCAIINCKAINCGIVGNAADGMYIGNGQQCFISGGVANAVSDTAFVLEGCEESGIEDCSALNCSSIGAITAVGTGNCRGNFIDGLTGVGWNASVTGGLRFGSAAGTANLTDTEVTGLVMVNTGGAGPAINITQSGTGTGRVVGITIKGRINGAGTQGVLVQQADKVHLDVEVTGTAAPVQIQTGCSKVTVDGVLYPSGANSVGVQSTASNDVNVFATIIGDGSATTHGVYFYGTATGCNVLARIAGFTVLGVGRDPGTVPGVMYIDANGGMTFGSGGVSLAYDYANHVLRAYGDFLVGGKFWHNGSTLGFFTKTPVVKNAALPADSTDLASVITLANRLKADLIAYGLEQ